MDRFWLCIVARAALFGLGLSACGVDSPDVKPFAYPTAGLYTPGSLLGQSDPTDVPVEGAGLGERCVSLPAPMVDAGSGTVGKLTVVYTTRTLEGRYAPKNCTAVWIETVDGRYVATIELRAGIRKPGLVYFQEHACPEKLGPDVVTSATLLDHTKEHEVVWKGLDLDGLAAPDGSYRLFVEVTETDKDPGIVSSFDFEKGSVAFEEPLPVESDGALESVTLTWEPAMAGGTG